MNQEKFDMFRNRLQKVYRHLSRQANRLKVSCFRVYDHDLPEFPFCIEVYEDKLYVAEYKRKHHMTEDQHEEWITESLNIISDVTQTPRESIFLRMRQKKTGRSGQYRRVGEGKREFVVYENDRPDDPVGRGLKFLINLSDYLDTGLFLDHRVTRNMVKGEAKGAKVLNLFCYTGSFSVYAASGGASEVVSVDISKTYLDWAKRNMQLNGFTNDTYKFVHADVKAYLKTVPGNYFDLVVMDPPTFSNSKRMEDFLDIQRDHVELIGDCLAAMKPTSTLYFSTNYKRFTLDRQKIHAISIEDITKATTPFDFEGKLSRYCFKIVK